MDFLLLYYLFRLQQLRELSRLRSNILDDPVILELIFITYRYKFTISQLLMFQEVCKSARLQKTCY